MDDAVETTQAVVAMTKDLFFFELQRPGATILIGAISIVHSVFHLPHCLMYRRLGILTAFWSIVGLGLVFGAVVESEFYYDVWIWYSCVYIPVMLVTMSIVLTAYIWEMNMKLLRIIIATIAIIFYLFMFYCIVFVNNEKKNIFSTSTLPVTTVTCPTCPNCTTITFAQQNDPTTTAEAKDLREAVRSSDIPKFIRMYVADDKETEVFKL